MNTNLTDEECERLLHAFGFQFRDASDHWRFAAACDLVERLIAARLAAQKDAIATAIEQMATRVNLTESFDRGYRFGREDAARIVREFGTEQP